MLTGKKQIWVSCYSKHKISKKVNPNYFVLALTKKTCIDCLVYLGCVLGLVSYVLGYPVEVDDDEYPDSNSDSNSFLDSDISLDCMTDSNSKVPNTTCIFPFTFKEVVYKGCIADQDQKTKRWCSTKTNKHGTHVIGEWGYCSADSARCPVELEKG